MRAHEFLRETANASISKRQQAATRGLNTFSDNERWNSDYTLNRVMMAVAMTDGTNVPLLDPKSWAGKGKTAHPYTEIEQQMLKKAYQAAGANWSDLNRGDMDSEELKSTNSVSPVKPFKGYPR
jgi:hypothetical protein